MKVICPLCPQGEQAVVIDISPEAEDVRCPQCNRRLRLMTRFVTEARGEVGKDNRYRYELQTVEEGGRVRPREITVPHSDIRIHPQTWVTFVRRGDQLVGVADQTHVLWFHIPRRPPAPSRWSTMWQFMFAFCFGLTLLFILKDLKTTASQIKQTPSLAMALLALLVVAALPALWWVVQMLTAKDDSGDDYWARSR